MVGLHRREFVSQLQTVRQIENYPTSSGDVPTTPITIADCGVLSPDDPSLKEDPESLTGDPYEDYPVDEDRDTENVEIALQIAKAVREIGNKLFKEGKTEEALQKYQSEFRILYLLVCLSNGRFQSPFVIWMSTRFFQTARQKNLNKVSIACSLHSSSTPLLLPSAPSLRRPQTR